MGQKEDKKKRRITCFKCKKRVAGKPKDISFVYQGHAVTLFKDGLECVSCAQKEFIEKFEEIGSKFVNLQEAEIKIDWQIYSEAYRGDEDRASMMSDILLSLGVFSFDPEGNWDIISDGSISLNPRLHLSSLYFTREEYAARFAGINFSNTQYSWDIRHVDRIISKEQAKKRK